MPEAQALKQRLLDELANIQDTGSVSEGAIVDALVFLLDRVSAFEKEVEHLSNMVFHGSVDP